MKVNNSQNVLFAITLFFISLVFCYIPKIMMHNKFIVRAYPLLNILIGGFQLATLLVDFLPHIVSQHDHHGHNGTHEFFPFIAMGYSFIILFAIDTLFLHGNRKGREDHHHSHSCGGIHSCTSHVIRSTKTSLQAALMLMVISFHSLFEGLAVTEINKKSLYYFGLMAHKILESFALGVSIFASTIGIRAGVLLMLLYSAITPIGILLSSNIIKKFNNVEIWINALSLGSLMYIIFIEIIAHGFEDGKKGRTKLIMLSLGYTIGSYIIYIAHS